jgi:PBP1b-binding outer membrane lipoprotein LpoB
MATSALAGTALGTAIPGLGNIAGLIIGAGIGAAGYYFGGKAGRAAGTAIGEAVSGNDEAAAQSPELVYNNSMLMHPGITPGYPYIFQYNAANNSPRIANTTTVINPTSVNDLIITPQGQFNTHPDDYIFAMKDPALLVNAGLMAVNKQYQTFQGAPGVVQNTTNTAGPQTVNDLIITPQGQFNARPDNYIIAMRDPALLANAGLSAVNKQYQTFQEAPGIVQNTTNIDGPQTVDDLLVTPQSQFGAPPGNYNPAMTDPAPLANAGLSAVNKQYQTFQGAPGVVHYNTNASQIQTANDLIRTPALVNSEIRNELRSVERVPPAIPPVIVDGEIELRSELTIDDKGYRLRQSVGKNTTPYKFTVGNVNNARLIQ